MIQIYKNNAFRSCGIANQLEKVRESENFIRKDLERRFLTVTQDLHGNCNTGSRKAAVKERDTGNGKSELYQAQERLTRKGKQRKSKL